MTCGERSLYLSLTEVAPHRFLSVVSVDGEVYLKLFGPVLKALGIVIRDASLPEIRGQGGVQAFGTIEVVDRRRHVPQLERSHPPLYEELGVTWVPGKGSCEALNV